MQELISPPKLILKKKREGSKIFHAKSVRARIRDRKVPGNLFQSWRDSKVSQSKERITIMTITATQGATTVTKGTFNNTYQE